MEAGRRGISYLVRARAFDRLTSFASRVVISTRDPRLLGQVIAERSKRPSSRSRRAGPAGSLRTYLADALRQGGRPDAALPFYEQAAAEAEAAEDWSDVGWICQNWANGLVNVGRLDDAKTTYLRSAEAEGRAGSPRVDVLEANSRRSALT